jgi:hypothetical protein
VSRREWLGLGAGLLAVVSLFLPWSTLSANASDVESALRTLSPDDVVRDAFKSAFLAWIPPILLLLVGIAVVLFGQIRKVRESGLPQLWLIAAAAILLLMVISWSLITLQFDSDQRGIFDAGGIVIRGSYGRYLGMAAAVVSVVTAFLDARATRVTRPTRGRR